jgi:1-acyl-sn-glycerol-3-phosphate acyltransferase
LKGRFFWWREPLRNVFRLWNWHGSLWHSYEIDGLENLPKYGPALLIFFHASFMPVDMMYFIGNVFLKKNRLIKAIADRDVFNKIGEI